MKHIVATGNPVDGLMFHGPFDGYEEATDWAEKELRDGDSWWVAQLGAPMQPADLVPKLLDLLVAGPLEVKAIGKKLGYPKPRAVIDAARRIHGFNVIVNVEPRKGVFGLGPESPGRCV